MQAFSISTVIRKGAGDRGKGGWEWELDPGYIKEHFANFAKSQQERDLKLLENCKSSFGKSSFLTQLSDLSLI